MSRVCRLCNSPECHRVIGQFGIETALCQALWEERPDVQERMKASWERVEKAVAEGRLQRFKEGKLRDYEKDWKPGEMEGERVE